nr:hypothetical protein [Gammaproteobacteria bacterium]
MAKSDDKKTEQEELKGSENEQDNPVDPDSNDNSVLNDPAIQDPQSDDGSADALEAAQFVEPIDGTSPSDATGHGVAHQGADSVQTPAKTVEAQGGPSRRTKEDKEEESEKDVEDSSKTSDLGNIKASQAGQFGDKQAGEDASSQSSAVNRATGATEIEGSEADSDGASEAAAGGDAAARRSGEAPDLAQTTAAEGLAEEPIDLTEQVLETKLDGEEEFFDPEEAFFDEGPIDEPIFDEPFFDDFPADFNDDFFPEDDTALTFIPETELPEPPPDETTTTNEPQLNAPDVSVEDISLNEDSTANLSIAVGSNSQDISEAIEVRISGVPDGVSLSEGSFVS